MQRTSKQPHWYAGQTRMPGEVFDVAPADINALLAMGHIERMDGDPDGVRPYGAQTYATRDIVASRFVAPRRSTLHRKAA